MSSNACCPPSSIGPVRLSQKETKGRMIQLEAPNAQDMPAYIVGKEQGATTAVIVFSDVFGVDSGNHKVVCDDLVARLGEDCLVIMPDLFRGVAILGGWNWVPSFLVMPTALFAVLYNLKTRMTPSNIESDLQTLVYPYLQTNLAKNAKIACVGFCFGAWVVGRALALDDNVCDVGVAIHPGWKCESIAGDGMEVLAKRVGTKPFLFLPAKDDTDMKLDSPTIQQLAQQRNIQPEDMTVEFNDMRHGWVTRGDDSDPKVAAAIDNALSLTVKFIQDEKL